MDLADALRNAFPDHEPEETVASNEEKSLDFYVHTTPTLQCCYEKRKGKPTTVIKSYEGTPADFKKLASAIKKRFNIGGGIKSDDIVIQGDYREVIMEFLKECGFTVKRVGG
ncbi:translation initiation factor [Flavobacteriaceae bacterium]|jgi:translation initiation factor 1|nr:translation initiation factor [Flavobacteriaceae bacterium]